ncbi:hypothetical protein D9619_007081 [Psilocybe cf. subviscida]|uniref:Major facilitator superfamily (MFS) profile domain-containing protein n=1 Tax=Psilocybe cf. subviscida TaxID=2480587 RepID=A0A8H5EW76_9AGAR|nr:hypothetical protein D9619_007081 [Psilocybe cf. subviscida]
MSDLKTSIPESAPSEKGSVDNFDTPEDRALPHPNSHLALPAQLSRQDKHWKREVSKSLRISSGRSLTDIQVERRIVGLTTDLHVSPPEYNTALALYFVALKRFDPQIWLPSLTLLWGIVSICQGLVTDKAGLFGVRFALGVAEAGLFPGVIYVFSVYYRRHERSWRVAIFFGGAALAGAFGGILAYAIGKMDGVGGRKGWEWIFILEGILTVAISLLAYFIVPTWSQKANFLTEAEKKRLFERLNADSDAALIESFQWKYVRQALTDHLVWGYALLFHGFAFVLYSLSLFMPTIIAGLGFATWKAQLMTVPPNALAAISIWMTVWISSKVDRRAPFIIGAAAVAILGMYPRSNIDTSFSYPPKPYVGTLFAASGVYTGNALLLSWPGENVSAQTKRAVAVAMQITIGDIGAIAGVLIYRPNLSAHRFRKPHLIAIGYLLFSVLVTIYLATWMGRENARRARIVEETKDYEPTSPEKRQEFGDRDIHYRYVI